MNEEIKEILDKLKEKDKTYHCACVVPEEFYEAHLLLDYITNLQEELETYKDTETYSKSFLYKENKERLKANQRLQEENERLKIEKQEEYNRFNLMAKFRDRALERTLIYKSRIDKAINYINEECSFDGDYYCDDLYCGDVKKLVDILQGSDNNENV